ncbi:MULTISPECIES: DUF3099 domain-containing protein [unclassified Streptomyces]|uniref:DUF3099 domain-containing protein n=1 Tax=unclassified Streptomyces TaxID=2593676 RepID=UPI00037E41DC|nr:DUF3099 domain-containing protein [Streptomyces sp. 303MFCol5.2]
MNPTPRHGPRPASITRARTGLSQDVRGRQRRYLAAMLVRTACVVVMAITWNRWPALAVCALAGGLVIPCVAVVAAQAGWGRQRGTRPVLAPVTAREESAARVPLEPTLVLPPEHRTAA